MPDQLSGKDVFPDVLISESEIPDQAAYLEKVVNEWIDGNSPYYNPYQWVETSERYWRKKTFAEAGGYLLNAHGYGNANTPSGLAKQVIEHVNDRRFTDMMSRNPRKLHHYVYPVIFTKVTGRLDSGVENGLEGIIERDRLLEGEHLPFRQLEFWYISAILSQIFGYTTHEADVKSILDSSILNHQPTAVSCTDDEAYYLTHNVMFYNNYLQVCGEVFSNHPAPYDIESLLRGLILRYISENNCDIVLELLASGVHQRQISREMVRLVLSWILEKVERHGYVPGPKGTTNVNDPTHRSKKNTGTKMPRSDWEYASHAEKVWAQNIHTNTVAGTTARLIASDWNELDAQFVDNDFEEISFRRDLGRFGQLLESFSKYDLDTGARLLKALADSPVRTEYPTVFEHAVSFLRDQRARDGEFGFWTGEQIMYTNSGGTPGSFRTNLVKPISQACQDALDAVDKY